MAAGICCGYDSYLKVLCNTRKDTEFMQDIGPDASGKTTTKVVRKGVRHNGSGARNGSQALAEPCKALRNGIIRIIRLRATGSVLGHAIQNNGTANWWRWYANFNPSGNSSGRRSSMVA